MFGVDFDLMESSALTIDRKRFRAKVADYFLPRLNGVVITDICFNSLVLCTILYIKHWTCKLRSSKSLLFCEMVS